MSTLRVSLLALFSSLLLSACDHPIGVWGDGDITSASGTRNCYLEDVRAGKTNCTKNTVRGAYQETYYATPREGWKFVRWLNYCTEATANECSFNVPADLVSKNWGQSLPPLVAVFEKKGGDQSNGQLSQLFGIWNGTWYVDGMRDSGSSVVTRISFPAGMKLAIHRFDTSDQTYGDVFLDGSYTGVISSISFDGSRIEMSFRYPWLDDVDRGFVTGIVNGGNFTGRFDELKQVSEPSGYSFGLGILEMRKAQ